MSWRYYLSRMFLMNPTLLTLMTIFYVPGTVYGYIWYQGQLIDTWNEHPHWQLPFVPDSPTASLFFALALIWLWAAPKRPASALVRGLRGIVEALGVVTSIKYGIWAAAIIFAGAAQGDVLVWQDWMLVVSHGAMAICALLYARFFGFGPAALAVAAAWTFLNDAVDYGFGVYPYLPFVLKDDLTGVAWFTFLLTAFSVLAAAWARFGPEAARGRATLIPNKKF